MAKTCLGCGKDKHPGLCNATLVRNPKPRVSVPTASQDHDLKVRTLVDVITLQPVDKTPTVVDKKIAVDKKRGRPRLFAEPLSATERQQRWRRNKRLDKAATTR